MTPPADHNLLFGLLALQTGMIDQSALVAAFHSWTRDKTRPMAEILLGQGAIDADDRPVLDALVAKHLKRHGGDVEKSLAAVSAPRSLVTGLAAVGDADVDATLGHVTGPGSASTNDDLGFEATATMSAGVSPGDGQRFRVLRPHARGGLGEVYVALDEELHREVALKQILGHHADDPASRTRFVLEAEITGGLEHPGIVPVYGLGSYGDGRPYYAMRFVRGGSLKEAIAAFHAAGPTGSDPGKRSLALRELLRRFVDVCNAIDYAHTRGVVHRDIKPANVIVGKHGETLVVDWGLAKVTGRSEPAPASDERTLMPFSAGGSAETLPGSAKGTPAYMSPEQASGDLARIGPRSDVYSLGATLYCLLTGHPPFKGRVGAVLGAAQQGDFPPPRANDPSIDRALEAVCLKAMALKPENRYATPKALADDVERWAADEPVSARREPLAARAGRWARRHRTAVAAFGLSLATAVVLLAVLNILVSKARRETARALVRVRDEQRRTADALARADTNFRRARQAVEDSFTTVSQEMLLDEPGMTPLRAKLLRSALEYHEAFFRERVGDPAVEAELAESHRRFAEIAVMSGLRGEAGPHLRAALGQTRNLARRNPGRPEYRLRLALTLYQLGVYLSEGKGGRDETVGACRESVALLEALTRERPADEVVQDGLARVLAFLGFFLASERGGGEEAARLLRRSRDILERLVADHPDSPKYRYTLADIHVNLYNKYIGNRGRQAEALRASRDAIDVLKGPGGGPPASPRYQARIGLIYDNRGLLAMRGRRPRDAIADFREARRVFLDVTRRNPEAADYQAHLGAACMKLGNALRMTGAAEEGFGPIRESTEAFERSLAANPDNLPTQTAYLNSLQALGTAQGGFGRYDEAVATLKKAVTLSADLCRHAPADVFLHGGRMGTLLTLGTVLTRAGRHQEAVAAYEESRAIGREVFGGDGGWSHLGSEEGAGEVRMAYSLRELGRTGEAERVLAAARREAGRTGPGLFEIAAYDARGAERLARRGGDPEAVEALRREAVKTLSRAVDLGFPDPLTLRRFGDVYQLRDRPDFRLLMLDLDFPADPFAKSPGSASESPPGR